MSALKGMVLAAGLALASATAAYAESLAIYRMLADPSGLAEKTHHSCSQAGHCADCEHENLRRIIGN